jgi:hypothetical protein
MVKCGVLFEVWAEFLNIIYTSIGFKGQTTIITEIREIKREEVAQ